MLLWKQQQIEKVTSRGNINVAQQAALAAESSNRLVSDYEEALARISADQAEALTRAEENLR
jgi:hypothetical protein